jgi:hypothetical protein
MVDRRWLGDLSLAILVALPLMALAWPQTEAPKSSASVPALSVGQTDRLPGNGRISLFG